MDLKQWHKDNPYGARTPEYVDFVLAKIKETWLEFPTERLGQMLSNYAGGADMFLVKDEFWFE